MVNMRFFELLALAFFRVFGITEPTDQKLRRSVWYLILMFTGIALGFLAGAAILFRGV